MTRRRRWSFESCRRGEVCLPDDRGDDRRVENRRFAFFIFLSPLYPCQPSPPLHRIRLPGKKLRYTVKFQPLIHESRVVCVYI